MERLLKSFKARKRSRCECVRQDHGEKEAECLIRQCAPHLGLPTGTAELALLRRRTTVGFEWIGIRLQMGHPSPRSSRGSHKPPETGHARHLRSANRAHSNGGRSGAYGCRALARSLNIGSSLIRWKLLCFLKDLNSYLQTKIYTTLLVTNFCSRSGGDTESKEST